MSTRRGDLEEMGGEMLVPPSRPVSVVPHPPEEQFNAGGVEATLSVAEKLERLQETYSAVNRVLHELEEESRRTMDSRSRSILTQILVLQAKVNKLVEQLRNQVRIPS